MHRQKIIIVLAVILVLFCILIRISLFMGGFFFATGLEKRDILFFMLRT